MVLDQNTLEIIVFFSVLFGALARTLLPYIQKLKEAEESGIEPPGFQRKYWFTMLFSLAGSMGVAMTLWPSVINQLTTASSLTGIVTLSAMAGWSTNSITNNIIKMGTVQSSKAKATEPPQPPAGNITAKMFMDEQPAEEKGGNKK